MGIKHFKFQPNEFVLVMKNGKLVNQGLGLSFFCNTLNTGMSVVPTVSHDTSFAFDDVITSDFQRINVQGDISYIIRDYEKVAEMIDFSYINKADYENKKNEAKQVMGKRITNLAKTAVVRFVSEKDIKSVIRSQEQLASYLADAMSGNTVIEELGLEVVTVSILAVSPQPETKKALEASTREEILQQQDDAIYKRRNAAIENERIVKENELNTEIKVAEKQREKDEKAIAAKMSIQEKNAKAEMQKLTDDAKYNEEKWMICRKGDEEAHVTKMARNQNAVEEAEVATKADRVRAEAQAYADEIILKAMSTVDKDVLLAILMSGMDSKTMIAKAFNSIAENTDKIGNLNISPELLESLTTSVGAGKH